jgi:biopolymer transport protein ExbB/TolQ
VYIESSKDILFIVLAFCALWFTAFVCWLLWYVIHILRDISRMMNDIHDKIAAIDNAVRIAKEKIEASFGSFGVAAAGIKMLGNYLEKRKDRAERTVRVATDKIKKNVSKVKKRLKEEMEEEESEDLM